MPHVDGMTAGPLTTTTEPIEVFLPDGTHVVLAFTGEASHDADVEEAVMEIVLTAGRTDGEFRSQVEQQLSELGLSSSSITAGREHVIVVGDEET
jgi:hypothetical protein